MDSLITLVCHFIDGNKCVELFGELLKHKATNFGIDGKLELNGLDLNSNSIKSQDFDSIFNQSDVIIEYVDFSQNDLKNISLKNWDHWNRLTDINLSDNKLKVIDKKLFELKKVKKLDLSNNKLSQLPLGKEVKISASLSELYLGNNRIKELGEALVESCIEILDLQHNRFEVVPKHLGKMKLLIDLNLIGNKGILEFPPFFTKMSPFIKELKLEKMNQVRWKIN